MSNTKWNGIRAFLHLQLSHPHTLYQQLIQLIRFWSLEELGFFIYYRYGPETEHVALYNAPSLPVSAWPPLLSPWTKSLTFSQLRLLSTSLNSFIISSKAFESSIIGVSARLNGFQTRSPEWKVPEVVVKEWFVDEANHGDQSLGQSART